MCSAGILISQAGEARVMVTASEGNMGLDLSEKEFKPDSMDALYNPCFCYISTPTYRRKALLHEGLYPVFQEGKRFYISN